MIRAQSMTLVSGRPLESEQQQIASGVGALLGELRRGQGMGVRDLERRSGVNRSAISRLEHGLRRPRRSSLGWLAWGLSPASPEPVKARLVEAAGDSLIAESRWSQRSHDRRAERALLAGAMPVPLPLMAVHAVAMLGDVLPGQAERLRQAQELARSGRVQWPPGLAASTEALFIAGVLAGASRRQLAEIGRTAVAVNDYAELTARRRRERARRALERSARARTAGL